MDNTKLRAIPKKLSLNCKGQLITLDKPVVMGILNATPDSFFDKSRTSNNEWADKAGQMLNDGATFIDIGGYSTRPGAADVSVQEETDRVVNAIEAVYKAFPKVIISVDTFRAAVAKAAIEAGASIVNDISSGDDDELMLATVAQYNVPYIMMHKRGTPKTMQTMAHYNDVTLEVLSYFNDKIKAAKHAGITDLILDPGFGFAKNLQHNYELLNRLSDLSVAELPILVGLSRKKMIQSITQTDAANALNGTTVANTIALLNGADILRVHDVKQAVECINIVEAAHGTI